jgi:peptidoglycan/LPS O-acetylase OafA/YrhL
MTTHTSIAELTPCRSLSASQEVQLVSPRVEELDSLRGIAALSVVLHHCLVVFSAFWAPYEVGYVPANPLVAALAFSPLHLAWGGAEAVTVFFVLSGLVLAFPFLAPDRPSYGAFVVKRMIRIYLPYLAVMAVAILLMEMLLPLGHPIASAWLDRYWQHRVDGWTVRDYLLMLGKPRENFVNPVIWSLVHELRICLIFPFLMRLVRDQRPWQVLLLSLLVSSGAKLSLHSSGDLGWWSTIVDTSQYLFLFAAGAELAKHRKYLSSIFRSLHPSVRSGMLAGSLLLLNARWEIPSLRVISALCIWLGAILIVALTLTSAGKGSFLRRRPLIWLGQISYSLYLTHCLVLFSLLFLLHFYLPNELIVAFVPFLSLCVAAGVYRAVEYPALSFARKLFPTRRHLASATRSA